MNTGNVTDWDAAQRLTEEDGDGVIDVYWQGRFNVSRAAADHFRALESGVFMHRISSPVLIGNFGQAMDPIRHDKRMAVYDT